MGLSSSLQGFKEIPPERAADHPFVNSLMACINRWKGAIRKLTDFKESVCGVGGARFLEISRQHGRLGLRGRRWKDLGIDGEGATWRPMALLRGMPCAQCLAVGDCLAGDKHVAPDGTSTAAPFS